MGSHEPWSVTSAGTGKPGAGKTQKQQRSSTTTTTTGRHATHLCLDLLSHLGVAAHVHVAPRVAEELPHFGVLPADQVLDVRLVARERGGGGSNARGTMREGRDTVKTENTYMIDSINSRTLVCCSIHFSSRGSPPVYTRMYVCTCAHGVVAGLNRN